MSEQLMQYENLGFVHLPGVIPPDVVARMRTAFNKAAAAHQPIWEREVKEEGANPAYFDIPDILDVDDAFIELADLPTTTPLRRQLFDQETPGVSYFDQRLDLSGIVKAHDTFRSVGKRFLKRVLMGSSVTKVK